MPVCGQGAELIVFSPNADAVFDPARVSTNITGRVQRGLGGDAGAWIYATVVETSQTSDLVQTGVQGEYTIPDLPLGPGLNTIQVTAVDSIGSPPPGAGDMVPRGTGYPLLVTVLTFVHPGTVPELLSDARAGLVALIPGASTGDAARLSTAIGFIDSAQVGLSAPCPVDIRHYIASAINVCENVPGAGPLLALLDDGLSCLVSGLIGTFGDRMGGRLRDTVEEIETLLDLCSMAPLGIRAQYLSRIGDVIRAEAGSAPSLAVVFQNQVDVYGTFFGELFSSSPIPGPPLSASGVRAVSVGLSRQVLLDSAQNFVRAVDLAAGSIILGTAAGPGSLIAAPPGVAREFALHDPSQSSVRRFDLTYGTELAPVDLTRFGPLDGGGTYEIVSLAYSDDGAQLAIVLNLDFLVFVELSGGVTQIDVRRPGAPVRPGVTWKGSSDTVFVVDDNSILYAINSGGLIRAGVDNLGDTLDLFYMSDLGVIVVVQDLGGGDLNLNVRLESDFDMVVRNIPLTPHVVGAVSSQIVKLFPRDLAVASGDGTEVVILDTERGFAAHRYINALPFATISADF